VSGVIVSGMESQAIARTIARSLIGHRNSLAGKAEDAHKAQTALATAARVVGEHRADHKTAAAAATQYWTGKSADGFDKKAKSMTSDLADTAAAAKRGSEIVTSTAASLDSNHKAVVRLVEEYLGKAVPMIDGARAAQAAGHRSAMLTAVGRVVDLVRDYTNESTKHVHAVKREMTDAAGELRKLTKNVRHDGVADPKAKPHHEPAAAHKPGHKPAAGHNKGVAKKVVDKARSQLGYHEGPGNANKYGPKGYWCSNFATWVWQKSGVDIGILPFTGDVYEWGRQHGLAYHSLEKARPGDVLLFGTGPQSPSTSTHIGIVESVHGNQVTLIEGNSADQVRRVTHPLSTSVFYGGVHPR
jgi:peptidoglycan DL-endopeptidase CwlO